MPSLPVPRLPSPPLRVPGLPDPFRRIRVPRDLDAITAVGVEEDPREAGMTRDGVERIWRAAQALFRVGVHPAIALCVRREGVIVLDRTLGWARLGPDGDPPNPEAVLATPDTPFCIYSTSKAVTATVAHLLDERGCFHADDRVCEYIPEYGRHGKEAITIEHVLSHRAGVPNLPGDVLRLEHLGDREMVLRALCDARPSSRPGRLLAYHAVSGGFIIEELVRRTTGRELRDVLAEEILDPLGFRWMNFGVADADLDAVAHAYVTGPPTLPPLSVVLTRALGLAPDEVTRISNDPRFLTGVVPAANVVTTAGELARFFDLLRAGGELDGVRVMEARTIRRAIVERSYREFDLTLGVPVRHSSGFMLGAQALSAFGPDTELAFGHLGFTNILGWADPERELAVGLITSGKPVVHSGLPLLWGLTRRIGREAPKVAHPRLTAATAPPRPR
jgi:CubicO group peptidase (beta-lactamase class C family)